MYVCYYYFYYSRYFKKNFMYIVILKMSSLSENCILAKALIYNLILIYNKYHLMH